MADGQHPLPWLFTVTRRLAIDAHRRRQHRPAEVSQETLLREVAADGEPDGLLDAQVIAAAVARLSRPARQVIVELFYRDRSSRKPPATPGSPRGR